MSIIDKTISKNSICTDENDYIKKSYYTLMVIITFMICIIGATYAYFGLSVSNNGMSGTSATGTLSVTVAQVDLKTENNSGIMVPQNMNYLSSAMNGTNKCVDGNNNIICRVYKVTVTNSSTATTNVNGTISFSGTENMPNLMFGFAESEFELGEAPVLKSVVNESIYDIETGDICQIGSTPECTSLTLEALTGTKNYYIVVFVNETGSSQTDSGTWFANITFEGADGTGITSTMSSSVQ